MDISQAMEAHFVEWLRAATYDMLLIQYNTDGSRKPAEIHFGPRILDNVGQCITLAPLDYLPVLVREALPQIISKFRTQEGRNLEYNLITVRVFLPDRVFYGHDCKISATQSNQSVWFTHTGAIQCECILDTDPAKVDFHEANGTFSEHPRSFVDRAAGLNSRLEAGRLSAEQFGYEFGAMLKGCPLQCQPQTVSQGQYMLRTQFDPSDMAHMFKLSAANTGDGSGNQQACIQIVLRELELQDAVKKEEEEGGKQVVKTEPISANDADIIIQSWLRRTKR
ncbi:uncharacterized protein AB675_6067 [Cyphellophora attinorum]|uniref:Uncharacterized protein n=1 Tax=Cyphellophora attinorum TaxID=1664694 RepID=A0A0N1NZ32_9EURO|nr:uncharacterized protein AB675_6067 [Phialophora attinorum]KPI36980.1 hypothetical protein AB675_6067 [Phialophora attinorum]